MSAEKPPRVDDTPEWAYEDDGGYCVCCGNGWWKRHMPDCELRDIIEQRNALLELARAADDLLMGEGLGCPDEEAICVDLGLDVRGSIRRSIDERRQP